MLRRVAGGFTVFGGDLVALAPGLSLDPEASARSVETAVRYTRCTLEAMAAKRREYS